MTIHITKIKAAVALVVVALLVPVTAIATHTFSDVPDGTYYTDAVAWAANNGVTTGTSATTFSPDQAVTRGQNVTFAYRYDQNVVQPALTDIEAALADLEASADNYDQDVVQPALTDLESAVAGLESLLPIARSASSTLTVPLDANGRAELLSVEIKAPVAGIIQLHGFVRVDTDQASAVKAGTVFCFFYDEPGLANSPELFPAAEVAYTGDPLEEVTCPVTGALTVEAGTHTIYFGASGPETTEFEEREMNALFVPGGSNDPSQ